MLDNKFTGYIKSPRRQNQINKYQVQDIISNIIKYCRKNLPSIDELFYYYDISKKGYIDSGDLENLLLKCNSSLKEDELIQFMMHFDETFDIKINNLFRYQQLLQSTKDQIEPKNREEIKKEDITKENIRHDQQNISNDSYFSVNITGEIESAEFSHQKTIWVEYRFMANLDDWVHQSGHEEGLSQRVSKGSMQSFNLNFPFNVGQKSTNIMGWPQLGIIINTYELYFPHRTCILGQTNCHIPCSPGRHVKQLRCYYPTEASPLAKLIDSIAGTQSKYNNPYNVMCQGEGREVTRTKSYGVIKVIFNITTSNLEKLGYSTT